MSNESAKQIWIDLENTPHVPFFIPIIRELESRGYSVILTARDFAQTKELVERAKLNAKIIGHEYGREKAEAVAQFFRNLQWGIRYGYGNLSDVTETPFRYFNPIRIVLSKLVPGYSLINLLLRWFKHSGVSKAVRVLIRSAALVRYLRGKNIALAVGHGSRGLLLASKWLRIPSLTLYDYEGASVRLFNRLSTWVMTPEIVPFAALSKLGLDGAKHLTYPGLKEEVYVCDFKPEPTIGIPLDEDKVVIILRPPSDTAHYKSDKSAKLFHEIIEALGWSMAVSTVCIPRTEEQRNSLSLYHDKGTLWMPAKAMDGLNLLYHADLVIGGGGTMNREAAVLGVPVVSIFKGQEGAVDRWLVEQGKMVTIERADEIIPFLRKRDTSQIKVTTATKDAIVEAIVNCWQRKSSQ